MSKPATKKTDERKKKAAGKKGHVDGDQNTKVASIPEFPSRHFTKDDEPKPGASINYFSKPIPLLESVKNALQEDEWEEIHNSPLGVLVDFFEMKISWASRLVHWMLAFQLSCTKKHEIWSLIGATPIRFSIIEFAHITGLNCDYVENLMNPELEVTTEMLEFWTLLGVSVETGPSYDDLVTACDICEDWEREDRLRLGYLAILATFIDAKAHGKAVNLKLARLVMDLDQFVEYPWGRVAFKILIKSVKGTDITKTYHLDGFAQSLQSWVFYALPKFASEFGVPNRTVRTPPLLSYGGAKGRKNFRNGMVKQTQVNSCIRLTFDEMFPRWDDDGKDERVDNILKAMYGQLSPEPWKWLPNHWSERGLFLSNNKEVEEPGQGLKRVGADVDDGPHKKARVEDMAKSLADALVAAVDARLMNFEEVVKEQLEEQRDQISVLTKQVEAISAVLLPKDPEPKKETTPAVPPPVPPPTKETTSQLPLAKEHTDGADAQSDAAGVSFPPLKKMEPVKEAGKPRRTRNNEAPETQRTSTRLALKQKGKKK